ncbi:MAG: hypothetical protein J5493_02630 [Lachnospiraceae bacterium]|nr:hypothetical protein [Lachnospiraceae bacterium]
MKKFIVLVLALAMVLSLAACGGSSNPTTTAAPQTTAAPETTKAQDQTTAAPKDETTAAPSGDASWETKGLPALTKGCLSGNILITSVGQSSEADTVANLLKRAKFDNYTQNNTVTADAVTSSYQVLVMVVGGSSKGLGGAGLDQDKETARVTAVIAKAQELGLKIVCMHIGGSDRRGTLSDAFINLAFPAAEYAVVLKEGDTDDLMKGILAAKNVPTAYIDKQLESRDVLAFMFGK